MFTKWFSDLILYKKSVIDLVLPFGWYYLRNSLKLMIILQIFYRTLFHISKY